ncbi:hypothetical protein LS48_01995 [Aequorivita aquimaris]|uniref:Uncharacterized protein n=1 Tax=Aequorivita aquimaris TaxID=1548749 RepID=A0A137RM41_9FLAO|nr:hypothetical protein [Aequorivita aquimaris]KXO01259.1 hypothetical protein LS48_01995 [Aequorivita aquimaris]
MKTDILVRLGYSQIFTQRHTIKSLLKEVDIVDSLILLTAINKYEYKLREKDNTELHFILSEWLIEDNSDLRNKIIGAYAKHSEKFVINNKPQAKLKTVVLVNRISTLRVIEILCSLSQIDTQGKAITRKRSRENLLKLYLLISDEIAERQDSVFKQYHSKNPSYFDDIHFYLFFGITQPLHHYYRVDALQPEIYKFLLFEKWFRANPKYSKLLSDYIVHIGLENWYQYFNDVFQLSKIATTSNIVSLEDYPVIKTLVEHLKINTSNNPSWDEFVQIRKSPLFKISEHKYAVLDFEFLLNKFFSSLYHDILGYSKENGFTKFAQDYVKEFVEVILLENVFQTSFGKSYIQFPEHRIKQLGGKRIENISLPDYYIRNGNNIIMFECKNSFLSNNKKISLNTRKLIKEIQDKFYFTINSKTNKKRHKGILQLLDYVINSMNGQYQFFDRVKKPERSNYFPILIVLDHSFTSLGFTQLLNYYFQEELKKSSIKNKDKVKPITIIHIDDFFKHQVRLKNLKKLIVKYHKYIKKNELFDSMISFSDYLSIEEFPKSLNSKRENIKHILEDSLLPPE